MKVLHFNPTTDSMIAQYVNMLCDSMGNCVESFTANSLRAVRKQIHKERPDILHLHGCWTIKAAIAASMARKLGVRTVLTPHGQLEQWVIKQKYWQEKLPRIILYQKRVVRRAYSLIAMGRMEENCLRRLNWNQRIEIVKNPLITESVSNAETGRLVYDIYRKVMDSNVLSLMDPDTFNAIKPLIKAGLTGDHQWLTNTEYDALKYPADIDMRKLILYAWQENILDTMESGMKTMNIAMPDIQLSEIRCYYPDSYIPPESLMGKSTNAITDENSRIVDMIKRTRQLASSRKLTISHVVELSSELRRCSARLEDDKIVNVLEKQRLRKFASRLMSVLADTTGLDEGFMPIAAIRGRKSKKIKTIITKHLEI